MHASRAIDLSTLGFTFMRMINFVQCCMFPRRLYVIVYAEDLLLETNCSRKDIYSPEYRALGQCEPLQIRPEIRCTEQIRVLPKIANRSQVAPFGCLQLCSQSSQIARCIRHQLSHLFIEVVHVKRYFNLRINEPISELGQATEQDARSFIPRYHELLPEMFVLERESWAGSVIPGILE